MDAVRGSMAGKTFRLTGLPPNDVEVAGVRDEFEMRADGSLLILTARSYSPGFGISEYTGRTARSCDGRLLAQELVLDYDWFPDQGWVTGARECCDGDPDLDYFQIFKPGIRLEDRGIVRVGRRVFRQLVAEPSELWSGWPLDASFVPVPRARLAEVTGVRDLKESILIDVTSLQVVQWELLDEGVPLNSGVLFVEDPLIQVAPPAGLNVPRCVK